MLRSLRPAFLALLLAACARATTVGPAAPSPTPAPASTPTTASASRPAPTIIPAARATDAPRNWHQLDLATDGIAGVGSERAMRELLAGRQPQRTVVVAVIDGGVDTAHVDLRANLWTNAKEIATNNADDDNNGYVDDVRGWNFIGGAAGRSVDKDTYELTRLHAYCTTREQQVVGPATVTAERCAQVATAFEKKRAEAVSMLAQVQPVGDALTQATQLLRTTLGTDSLTEARVRGVTSPNPDVQRARAIWLQLAAQGITAKDVKEMVDHFQDEVKYNLDPAFRPRAIVGDNYLDPSERRYGNGDVTGPDASHGTHVAGIIGAVRGNGVGIDGIAPSVRIMSVRTVPNGDERDKDVANAIRYAADNGAHIINMSFGKAYSPQKPVVDAAVRYAESRGVLLVHAAGNDGQDNGVVPSFPTPVFEDGSRAQLWIEVGASSWKGGESLVTSFSNYNKSLVDLFAPGEDILSTMPNGAYERQSGTSMAAPVVTGVAALLMAYFPDLTAADVKRILLETATRPTAQVVQQPGTQAKVPFASLSATGGIVNAYDAVRKAQEMSRR